MNDKITTLKTYETIVDAMVDLEVLKDNNIECSIANEGIVELYPMFNEINDGLKIVVFERDLNKALELITEFHNQDNLS